MLEPMKRTEILYSAMKDFTDARIAARAEYFAKMKPIETAKGSKYYNDARKEAEKARIYARSVAEELLVCRFCIILLCLRN